MSEQDFEFPKLDRSVVSIVKRGEDELANRLYWQSCSPEERLHQVEVLRRLNYGDRALARLQRVFEIAQR